MSILLEMKNISKTIKGQQIYRNVSYQFKNGCYGVLGPNGIGKTILLEMLAGITAPDSGSICLANIGMTDSIEYKKNLVYVPSNTPFFPSVTGAEFLSFILSVKSDTHNEDTQLKYLIDGFKLKSHLNTRFNNMSLGTQKKLFLATLAIGNNKLILLDEPSNGLDNESHQLLCKTLLDISRDAIIIFATHDPLLLNKLSPTIIRLSEIPTQFFDVSNTQRSDQIEISM